MLPHSRQSLSCPFRQHIYPSIPGAALQDSFSSPQPSYLSLPFSLNLLSLSASPRFRTQSVFCSWRSNQKVGSTYPFISPQFARRINASSSTYYVLWPRMNWKLPTAWKMARNPGPGVCTLSQTLTVARCFLLKDALLWADRVAGPGRGPGHIHPCELTLGLLTSAKVTAFPQSWVNGSPVESFLQGLRL